MPKKSWVILKIMSILFLIVILLKFCLIFFKPFVISVLLVILIEPLVEFFNKLIKSRRISVWLSIIAITIISVIVIYYISKYAFVQILNFLSGLPNIIHIFSEKITFLNNTNYDHLVKVIEDVINTHKSNILNTVISTANGIVDVIIIIMITIFLSIDFFKFKFLLKKIVPLNLYTAIKSVNYKVLEILNLEMKIILITTLFTVIGLCILGVSKPLTIGLICGILDLLPVVGTSIIFIPWIAYEMIIKNYPFAIGMVFLFILLQVSRQVMEIRFMGMNLKIHPVTTIFSLYAGFIIFGVWGVIFGPFMIVLSKELFNTYDIKRSLKR